jgi:hypothetical protein
VRPAEKGNEGCLSCFFGDRTEVVDLRQPKPVPIVIARAVPDVETFVIRHGAQETLENPGVCDPGSVLFIEWSNPPRAEVLPRELGAAHLVGTDWLMSQRNRSILRVPRDASLELSDKRVPLRPRRAWCDETKLCGAALPFGGTGWQLVLVELRDVGGHCPSRKCVLFDPIRGLFAAPPDARRWGSLPRTRPQACGPYRFDAAMTRYLAPTKLCTPGARCQPTGGEVLGWLDPGPSFPFN